MAEDPRQLPLPDLREFPNERELYRQIMCDFVARCLMYDRFERVPDVLFSEATLVAFRWYIIATLCHLPWDRRDGRREGPLERAMVDLAQSVEARTTRVALERWYLPRFQILVDLVQDWRTDVFLRSREE